MYYELVDKALHDVRHCRCSFRLFSKSWIPADLADQYLAGAVLLGAAPCTAMVFVWSYLTKGDAAYTLVQVAVNDLIILIAFAPIVALLLGVGSRYSVGYFAALSSCCLLLFRWQQVS